MCLCVCESESAHLVPKCYVYSMDSLQVYYQRYQSYQSDKFIHFFLENSIHAWLVNSRHG